ncbi:MAG: S1 RNA-binding domain-containing protein [Flagellimonas sp.]
MFLDFCKSGHISTHEILKIKRSKGEWKLPNHIISRVFLRGNRLYYSGEESRIKNIFHSNPSDDLPDPFVRVAILKWLYDNRRKKGPSGIIGFHRASDLIKVLLRYGHSFIRVNSQLIFLLKESLIISESQDINELKSDELISINPPGVVHYELLRNNDYLAACSENVWYKTVEIAESISQNMSGQGRFTHLSIQNNIENAELLINYLNDYYDNHFKVHTEYLSDENNNAPCDFNLLKRDVESFKNRIIGNPNIELESGSIHSGKIISIKNYGLICEIDNCDQVGLIHVSLLPEEFDEIYNLGDTSEFEIIEYKRQHNKYNLKFADKL